MGTIFVKKLNEVYMQVTADEFSIEMELSHFFAFKSPNARYRKKKSWDGNIRLYNRRGKLLYVGLLPYLCHFARERKYKLEMSGDLYVGRGIDRDRMVEWISALELCSDSGYPIQPEEFQIDGILGSVNRERNLVVAPTGSGKSLIMYCLMRWYVAKGLRMIIIVPTTSLVEQLWKDFRDYSLANGFDVEANVQKLYAGHSRTVSRNALITTWHSVYEQPKEWFYPFGAVIGDEAHGFKAKSLIALMEKMTRVRYRIGTTGTLDDIKVHKLILEGLFGSVNQVATFRETTEIGRTSDLKITCILFQYDNAVREMMAEQTYHKEMEFLVLNESRNNYIKNLACALKGNTLILFNYVEKHGIPLYEKLCETIRRDGIDKRAFFISGAVITEKREQIRAIADNIDNAVIVASYGTFSTGVNIPSLENLIFAHPFKSKIRNLQSIGRGLRVRDGKTHCNLYDLGDDMTLEKRNHSMRHAMVRYKLYTQEQFDKRLVKVQIE